MSMFDSPFKTDRTFELTVLERDRAIRFECRNLNYEFLFRQQDDHVDCYLQTISY